MPTYTYHCDNCHHEIEDIHDAKTRLRLTCEACDWTPMTWRFPSPNIQTDSTFLANHRDDGFGADDASRKIAYARARAAGVNPTGKVYCPSLCPSGERLSPSAWINSKADVKARCRANGWGSPQMGIKPVQIDEAPKPYRVADDIVDGEVARVVRDNDGDVTPRERKQLTERVREQLTPAVGSV